MINQITKMRLPDGTEVAFVDWSDQPLWSSAYLLDGFTDDEVPFFTYAQGSQISVTSNVTVGRAATERDTNVTLGGAFADTEEMLVYAIKPSLSFYRTSADDATDITTVTPSSLTGLPNGSSVWLKLMADQLILRLWISQKVMIEADLGYFNAGFGPNGVAAMYPAATTTQRTYANQGLPSQDAVRSLAMPVYIGGTEKYRITLSNFTGGAVNFGYSEADSPALIARLTCYARLYMDGLYKRPVS